MRTDRENDVPEHLYIVRRRWGGRGGTYYKTWQTLLQSGAGT